MPDISFFTSESFKFTNSNDEPSFGFTMSIENDTSEVNKFMASNFEKKAVTSFNEIFCPYTTKNDGNENYLPVAMFYPREPVDAVDQNGNPLQYKVMPDFGSGDSRQEVIAYDLGSGINYGTIPTFDGGNTQIYDKDDTENIRSVALRSPVMIAGFGYNTEGMPAPSEADRLELEDDSYEYNRDDGYRFAENVKSRSDLWNAGPLDIRWDEHRQMYVAAPETFIGYALCDIPAASGRWAYFRGSGNPYAPGYRGYRAFTSGEIECAIGRYDDFHVPSGADGNTVFPLHKLLIINRSISMDIASGSLVVAQRLNNGEYFPIFADCSPDLL